MHRPFDLRMTADKRTDPPSDTYFATIVNSDYDWRHVTVPQPNLNNRSVGWPLGKVRSQLSSIQIDFNVAAVAPKDSRRFFCDEWHVPRQAVEDRDGCLERYYCASRRFVRCQQLGLGDYVRVHEKVRELRCTLPIDFYPREYFLQCVHVRIRRSHAGFLSKNVTMRLLLSTEPVSDVGTMQHDQHRGQLDFLA